MSVFSSMLTILADVREGVGHNNAAEKQSRSLINVRPLFFYLSGDLSPPFLGVFLYLSR